MFKKAFTLVELVIVVVMIGILSALAVPNLSYYKENAYESSFVIDYESFERGVELLKQSRYRQIDHTIFTVIVDDSNTMRLQSPHPLNENHCTLLLRDFVGVKADEIGDGKSWLVKSNNGDQCKYISASSSQYQRKFWFNSSLELTRNSLP